MTLLDWFHFIKTSITTNKARSALTLLGVAIGVASVSLLTSIGQGVNHYITDNFAQFGTRIVAVNPGRDLTQSLGGIISSTKPLTLEDANALLNIPGVENMVANVQGVGTMEYKNKHRDSDILGTGPDMAAMFNFAVEQGTFLPKEIGTSRPMVVLGSKMKQELFGNENALGKYIRVSGSRFRVVGVMESKGQMMGMDLDDLVYIPVDRALMLFNRDSLMEIDVTYSEATTSEQVASQVQSILTRRHKTQDFTITTQDQMLATLDSILTSLTAGIGLIASVSLLVGGVGIYTIMTIAVEERTAEIGLLKSIGASRKQIMSFFIGEAALFGVIGGIIGLCFAIVIIALVWIAAPNFPLYPHVGFVFIAFITSISVGMAAGITPAYRAARLAPVDALRAE